MTLPSYLRLSRPVKFLLLIAILLFAIFRSWYGTRLDSMANDEPWHIIASAYYIAEGDYRLNPEHPPLSKDWVGLWNQHLNLRPLEVLDDKDHERQWVQEIMFLENDARTSHMRSRMAMYSFHFILGLGIALLLWHIFGFGWAAVSMLWLAIDPSIGAHQPVVLTDLPLSFTLILAAVTGGMFCYSWKWKWAAAFGIAMGLAFAVKHSALPGLAMMIGVSGVLVLIPVFSKDFREFGQRFLKWAAAGILMLITLWAAYGFHGHTSDGGEDFFNRSLEQKITDLNTERWRTLLTLMDDSGILPKAYIWGLADTIRAGIEGRGDDSHYFFGEEVFGRAPTLYFPGVISVKVPIALLLIFLGAVVALIVGFIDSRNIRTRKITKAQWYAIAGIALVMLAHLTALATGRTSYGGIRHALPIVAMMGILSGAIFYWRFPNNRRLHLVIPSLLLVTAFAMTIGEKRIWEYFNEIVGGTENGYKCFCDEGVYLGQRFYETESFLKEENIDPDEYINTLAWYMKEEQKASQIKFDGALDNINDTTMIGTIKDYFLLDICIYNTYADWDPKPVEQLEKLKRIGNIMIAHGEIRDTTFWAYGMNSEVFEYLSEEEKPDWNLVARRLELTTKFIDFNSGPFLVLGNAYLRTGKKEQAINAYQKSIDNLHGNDPNKAAIFEQIERVRNSSNLLDVAILRPYFLE